MRLVSIFALACAYAGTLAAAAITWRLQRAASPSSDQADAYRRIEAAMTAAVARYTKLAKRPNKTVTVQYVPSVSTADGNLNGNIRFGSGRSYMTERTALHEISHTLGIGLARTFDSRCKDPAVGWPSANKLVKTWDGEKEYIHCGGGHVWPYGLNYEREMNETNADRHCLLIDAMLADGLAN